jgi:crotonobetainyl-CoA:carnitine CoA-transferase CaiB-like acyl-CoA transferase
LRPFHNVRVLDLTRVVSGPYCTQTLGMLGAEIIKVEERGEGDATRGGVGIAELKAEGLAATFIMFNAGKKSLTLDLKKDEAKAIVKRLARDCDVVVENFRPGAAKRLGLDYESLKKENPRLIYCSISGFGQTGPDAKAPAFDGNIQAASGMMAMTGEPDGPPLRAGFSVCDTSTGLNAALAISAALYQRRDTDKGQYIDVAMLDSGVSLASQTIGAWLNGGKVQPRRGNLAINFEPTADVYNTADGSLILAIMRDEHVKVLLDVIGLGSYKTDERFANREIRVKETAFIRQMVQEALMKDTTAGWKAKLEAAGVPFSPIMDVPEALTQPQLKHRGLVQEMTDAKTGKPMRMLSTPFLYEHGTPKPSGPPPRLGEHTAEILKSAGYSDADIAALTKNEVI